MSKRMSRENQKLIYWFIDCYAYKLKGVDINWQTSKQKPAISDYFLYKAKEDLKKLYIKHSGINLKRYKPFKNIEEKLRIRLNEVLDKNYTKETKINIVTNDLIDFVREEMQRFLLTLTGTFSLKLDMMSNKGAIAFTNYLFDYFLQNDIDMWQEIHELYRQQENRNWVYWMLKKKICVITGKPNAQLAHISKSAGALGGYKYDKGTGNSYLPLSAEWHIGVDHGVGGGRNKLIAKLKELNIEPFEIKTEEEVKELKKIYKGHFKGFKEEK